MLDKIASNSCGDDDNGGRASSIGGNPENSEDVSREREGVIGCEEELPKGKRHPPEDELEGSVEFEKDGQEIEALQNLFDKKQEGCKNRS